MENDELKMFTCKKYGTGMLAAKADETCAKRFAISIDDKNLVHDFVKCNTCRRGAIQYELGKHKGEGPGSGGKGPGETKGRKTETNKAKGETNMAKEWHKSCEDHGPYTATGPRGGCPKCKAAAGKPADVELKTKNSELKTAVALGGGDPLSALSIDVDLARFPKLHSRLVSYGLNAILAEMEAKA